MDWGPHCGRFIPFVILTVIPFLGLTSAHPLSSFEFRPSNFPFTCLCSCLPCVPVSPAVGEHLTLTISDIAFGGEGVARIEDFVIFVPFVLVGEVVEAE